MQKNVPKYTPEWVETVTWWAETSKRDVRYALCNDRRTLLWFANQRAIEYHPALVTVDRPDRITHLVLDLDPPEGDGFAAAVAVAHLVQQALADVGLAGALKTSGAKGVHIFVPVDDEPPPEDSAAAVRAIAARTEQLDPSIATTAFIKDDREGKVFVDSTARRRRHGGRGVQPAGAARSAGVVPARVGSARRRDAVRLHHPHRARRAGRAATRGPSTCPRPSTSRDDLIAEGHEIPVARVQAMHEGKRRKRARGD